VFLIIPKNLNVVSTSIQILKFDMAVITIPTKIIFPDTHAAWPWPRALNPYYEEAKAASAAWIASFECFTPQAQKAFDACDFNLLAALAYSTVDKETLRFGCDLMNIFFVYDECSDCAEDTSVRRLADIIMDALRNPHRPRSADEHPVGEIVRQFWERATAQISASAAKRFVSAFDLYTASVVQEAQDRTLMRFRSIDEYLVLRRQTIGGYPTFVIMEFALDLPLRVLEHPALRKLRELVVDIFILSNDMYSYNVEQARGDVHNIVMILMRELGLGLSGALDWIAAAHDTLATEFLSYYDPSSSTSRLPSFGSSVLDEHVRVYVDGLGQWVRGLEEWTFESKRYFGDFGEQVRETREVEVLRRHERLEVCVEGKKVVMDIMPGAEMEGGRLGPS